VIRRGFWLAVGATGGIMGYRRVSSLGRQVSQTLGARPKRPEAVKRHWARESIRFTRDVRDGMDLYSARHPRPSGPTLGPGTGAGNSTDHDEREDH
jgi:hypothetical protein